MSKYKFIANMWLTFEFENEYFVGRTIVSNGKECVASVSESGKISLILFSKINNVKQLKILNNKELHKVNFDPDRSGLDLNINNN